jgi:F420H(2)-dependent quinone reductase
MELWIKILMAVNIFLYRLTGGRLGGILSGQSVLLLDTVGRKTGRRHTIPINYYRDGERYVIVASNWGKNHHPAWYFNLMSQPVTQIQVKNRKLRVRAQTALDQDYERLWQSVTSQNEFYIRYQKQTWRKIPLVILTEMIS